MVERIKPFKEPNIKFVIGNEDPSTLDIDYPVPCIWINSELKTSWMYYGSGVWRGFDTSASESGGIEWSAISSDTNALPGHGYLINASDNDVTILFPSNPETGDTIGVSDAYNKALVHTITIDRNGKNIEGIASDLIIDISGASVTLVFMDETRGWEIINEIGVSSSIRRTESSISYDPSILTTDYIIAITNTDVARDVIISDEDVASGTSSKVRTMFIKDESGNASVNNITISLESGNIDGVGTKVISASYGSVRLYLDGTNAWTL
jgi:hypothetical protein